ncbi:MAG TPA: hypothetical protein VF483_09310 [Gemmatimonadaceae bacterium]
MALWNKLKDELRRAGTAAQEAIDEGKLRLDLMRTRQAMDKAATKVGYAVYRARKAGGDVPADEWARLSSEVANAEAEIERIETLMREAAGRRKNAPGNPPPPSSAS